jgi:ribosome maturation factor RimP
MFRFPESKFGLSGYTSCCLQLRDGFWKWALPAFFYVHSLVVTVCLTEKGFVSLGESCEAEVKVMSELIIDKIRDYLQSLLPSMELELFDVQFRREGHGWVLRVFIESESGVTLEHCSNVSRELGRYLDVEDLIDNAYHLEVSSPGLERPLRSLDDFNRYRGKKARVKVHEAIDGEKIFEGIIEEVTGDADGLIYLKLNDGRSIQFTFEKINKARLAI